jgi:8-oxo-dGTP pyrophosphatase MutT (NUDIX family)
LIELPANWQALLAASVSPLAGGARSLRIKGFQPANGAATRPARTAAVLVGITEAPQPEVVLTRRALHLPQHPGQVSFPGGAAMNSDPTGVTTALREAEEEIGLRPHNVQPLGFLDRIDTFTDFRVLPVVGLVRQAEPFVPDLGEVEAIFTLPLAQALNIRSWQCRRVQREGQWYNVYSMHWQGFEVWGITAAILMNLARRVDKARLAQLPALPEQVQRHES